MAADNTLKNLRGTGRRDFIRWTTVVAATLGLERSRYLNVLGETAGVALADTASCASTMKSVHLVSGGGGFAWFQLLFPMLSIAKPAGGTNVLFQSPNKVTDAPGSDNPLVFAAETPWQKYGKAKQISAFMAGSNQAHTNTPSSAATIAQGTNMLAAISAIQSANPTLLPVIGVNPFDFGTATGAASVASVGNADGLVDLFNSAASQTLLKQPQNASMNEAYVKAFLSLNAAAGRPTIATGYQGAKVAANLLGRNVADALRPDSQLAAYGINSGTPTDIKELAKGLITGLRAFKLGLTSMLILPPFVGEDPHGGFNGGIAGPQMKAAQIGKVLDGFMDDAANSPDPSCSGKSLADTIVMTMHGDTPKNAFSDPGNWNDGTPNGANWLFVMGNGYTKTGWFGSMPDANTSDGFDPTTGKTIPGQASSMTTGAAAAAAAYAVAKGDMRRVQDFYNGAPITGITNPVTS